MNEQSQEVARCAPMQLLNATPENSATTTATEIGQNRPKATSIRELRTQLRAQQGCNLSAMEMGSVAPVVAPSPGSCAVALPRQRNCATGLAQWQLDLVAEFMEVDGLSLADAQALAAVSVQPRSEAAWLMLLTELDALISRYVAANGLPEDVQARLLGARSRQSLASIPDSIAWFKAMLDGADPDQRGRDGQA
jgi:hypothetical protein